MSSSERTVDTKSDTTMHPDTDPSTGNAVPPVDASIVKDDEDTDENEDRYLSGMKLWAVLVPVVIGYFLMFLDTSVVATAAPAITARFNSLADIGWYGGAYQLGTSAFQPLTGKLYSHFSTKWTYLSFLLVFEIGSVIAAAAVSSPMFIFGRAIAGVGAAGIGTGSLTVISCVLPVRKQAKATGLNIGMGLVGVALGPVLGGVLTEYASWRWCFYINLPLGGAFAVLLLFSSIPEVTEKLPPRQVLRTAVKSLDLPGFMLICPAAVMILLGLQFGGTKYAWDSSVVIGLIVGGFLTVIVFIVWEYHQGNDAMIPMAILRQKVIWSAAATYFFLLGTILAAEYYLAMYFQTVHADSPSMSGVHILPLTVSVIVFTIISGAMTEKLGYYLPWSVGGAAVTSIGYGLMSTFKVSTPSSKWIGYQILYGIGGGSMLAIPFIAVQNCVAAADIPIAMAIVIFTENMGAAVWLVVANAIFNNGLRRELERRVSEIRVDPSLLVEAGGKTIRTLVQGDRLVAVLECYTKAITQVMYLGVGIALATMVFSCGLGWKDVRVTKNLQAMKASKPSTPMTEDEKRQDAEKPVDV